VSHIIVIANETVASPILTDMLRTRATDEGASVTVIAPVSEPRHGYVVYEDTRRAAAGRRLERTLRLLRDSAIPAQGFVVECSPVQAAKDALAQLEPPADEVIVATHAAQRSSWMRRNVVEEIRKAAGSVPVRHVVADADGAEAETNVLVVANETVLSAELLDRVRSRAASSPSSFLIVAPQDDDLEHPEAARRLRRALSELRSEGIDAHGQVVHPDPFTAVMEARFDERIDEVIVSTFSRDRSGWLRRDLIERLRREVDVPVEHVVSQTLPINSAVPGEST